MMTLEDWRERDAELCAEIERQRTEIERLKTALGPGATEAWEYMYDEIERLKAALQPFAKMYAAPGGDLDKAIQNARAALEPKA